LNHYSRLTDVQTLAMLCYLFGDKAVTTRYPAPMPTIPMAARPPRSQPPTPAVESGGQQSVRVSICLSVVYILLFETEFPLCVCTTSLMTVYFKIRFASSATLTLKIL